MGIINQLITGGAPPCTVPTVLNRACHWIPEMSVCVCVCLHSGASGVPCSWGRNFFREYYFGRACNKQRTGITSPLAGHCRLHPLVLITRYYNVTPRLDTLPIRNPNSRKTQYNSQHCWRYIHDHVPKFTFFTYIHILFSHSHCTSYLQKSIELCQPYYSPS